ncbi:VOC family protein [Sphingopyxis sp.]|jgi:PhnB protein|uniref:VOC family protein n=1 Tax=Sphingopyxis sp. TaxID=1908224 RepID=UPI002FC8ABA2
MSEEYCAMAGVVPHLTIRGNRASEAIDFYMRAFGASESGRHMAEDGQRILHAHLELNGGPLMLNDDFPEMGDGQGSSTPAGVGLHLDVPDADAAWDRALAAGASVRFPLDNQFWGQRYGQVTDPFGHIWSIGGPVT